MSLQILGLFLVSGTAAVVGNVLLKAGMNQLKDLNPSIITNWQIVIGFLLYGLSSILYLNLLAFLEVTKVYRLLVAYMFIVLLLLGTLFLKESLTLTKVAGMAIILLGIFLSSK